jgi:epoxyqueuosine reductase
MLLELIRTYLSEEGIEYVSAIKLKNCEIKKPYLLQKAGIDSEKANAIIFAVPYHTGEKEDRNISLYAISRDYHLYFDALFSDMCTALGALFPKKHFCGFADNSPIDERHAAAIAGLGVLGDNGLLLNEKYGSYVFIGEIISDLDWEDWYEIPPSVATHEIQECLHCGACSRVCPMQEKGGNPFGIAECLSSVSQKKRLQSDAEAEYIRHYRAGWGCDRCQTVCPYNKAPKETPIPFFKEDRMPYPTVLDLRQMPDETFAQRAFAWRGRETVIRNLQMLENKTEEN